MRFRLFLPIVVCVSLLLCPRPCVSEDNSAQTLKEFETHIRPVLSATCIKCHGPTKQEGKLRLDTLAGLLKGGESGPAILPGRPSESLLVSALRYEDLEMPPKAPLSNDQINHFARWISAGAAWPTEQTKIRETGGVTEQDRTWWAFQPVVKPTLPPQDDWSRNEIDRFVYRELASRKMQPAPTAEKATLARRLYFNVIGLPPTPQQLDAFLSDTADNAYEKLIDQLLTDQAYGEHWARFWLDLVRYAESDGWKADDYRPDIWRYRDYVVNAFNHDKPYPQFVREQLAGDEIPDPTPESLAATGYLRLGIYEYNQRNSRQHWDDILNEITDVTGDAFLGMGLACARCHDHKFDPLLQVDYFKLRAFFEPLVFNDEERYATENEMAEHEAKQKAWEAKTVGVREQIDSLLKPYHDRKWFATVDKFPLDIQASFAKPIEQRDSWDAQMAYFIGRQFYEEGGGPLNSMKDADKARHTSLLTELAKFDATKPTELPALLTATNHDGDFAPTTIPNDPQKGPIDPGFMHVLADSCGPEFPDCGNQRRTALADWISNPSNPLTSRVIVNRIWKQHFGRGIVSSVSDFGSLGGQPSHPQLLDWLTATFIEDGWSFKRLHKRILMSETWRQSASHPDAAECEERDPSGSLLWRRDVRRLSAEQIRDAMLTASGERDTTIGGPSVMADQQKRSLYVKSFRNTPDTFLSAFDIANGLKSVGQRNTTTTPTQALLLINGDYTLKRAKALAQHVSEAVEDAERVEIAVRRTWNRDPTPMEVEASVDFVRSKSTEEAYEKLVDFCHVLLNSNEFLYVD